MNNYGLNLDELGFSSGFTNRLLAEYVSPIAAALYPEFWPQATAADTHKARAVGGESCTRWADCCGVQAFVVKYDIGGDVQLASHWDDAEVTMN